MTIAIGVVVVVAIFVIAAWASGHMRHPEQTATHPDVNQRETTSERFYAQSDRPAGPDAEDPPAP
jgi:hypothetical protein